ncbi:rhomboid family intramembrane serine protease [Butyrivibrio sp.]|jgi:GlpG protein|uniref:rhomboid family intramembrane serine protease n=1 Tax=Butyrivibrio sp. TaxID=28121 RepID=UPI0025BE3607|nr:rhomboid family intramembrane serine protease [Butyrivibrio sp.]MBE5837948.1 rhomboid family intramembrane serine protease [Butyrivibrio sp.]
MRVGKIKISFNSPVILGFVFASLVTLILGIVSGGRITDTLFVTYHSPLSSPLTYVRFFTHVLGHANWEHFIGNASYILLLGPLLEEKHGSQLIVFIILVTALVTALVNYIFFWNVALCGASGVVFAFILLTSFTSFREGEIPLTFILVAVIFIGQQVFEGLFLNDNVSNLSHIIGGIVGAVIGYVLNKKK